MKYVGSKIKIANDIVPIIQKYIDDNKIDTYIEPFVGGCNIIDKICCEEKIGNDLNKDLIEFYKATIEKPSLLDTLCEFVDKDLFFKVRDNKQNYETWYYMAIMLFASYNADLQQPTYGGMAKTKEGNIRNYFKEALNNYKKQLPNLHNIKFTNFDYSHYSDCKNCLIYCDIPYQNCNKVKYIQDFDYDKFWQWARDMSKYNIVLISKYDAPQDFECIWYKEVNVSMDYNSRQKRIEKLFILKK